MNDDQFDKLYEYMERRFNSIEERLELTALKTDVQELRDTVIDFASRLDEYAQEMAAMQHKIDRLEKYIQILADKAGVDLDAIHV